MERFEPYDADFLPPREAFTAALRVLIISACSRGEVATSPFAELYDLRKANVRYLFRWLREAGILRISKEERAGGFPRRYYVTVRQREFLDEEFAQMAPKERQGVSLGVLWDLSERCREACEAGTINALPGSHLSRFDLLLDLEGWTAVMVELKRIFDRSFEIQAEALSQLKVHPEVLLGVTFALAGFEAPRPSRLAPGETPLSRRLGPTWAVASNFSAHARLALRDGTMDARDDSHLTWSPFVLTPRSWQDLSAELTRSRARILEIQAAATSRLELSAEKAIPTTVALFGFKSAGIYNPSAEMPLAWPPPEFTPFHP
jgi:DNA-binding transcriptional ArsR family regulator